MGQHIPIPPRLGRHRHLAKRTIAVGLIAAIAATSASAAEASSALGLAATAPAPVTAPAKAEPVTERPDRTSAALAARLQGSRVLITGETTETTLVYANPDGSFTMEANPAPVRVQRDGGWHAIDTTLIERDGILAPKMAKADVEISAGGGDAPLAKLERNSSESFALSWPSPLPAPQVEGNKATYVDAAGPGADLVVTALPTGFRHDVVLRERPSGPVEYKLAVDTDGLKLAETTTGALTLTNDAGKTVATAPQPVMYEAAAEQPTTEASTKAPSEIDTRVLTEDGQQMLVLTPDADFLADPATQYPVVVDPTTTLGVSGDGFIRSHIADMANGDYLKVGSSDNGATKQRSLIKFNVASLAGKHVTAAEMRLWSADSGSCDQAGPGVVVRRLTANWSAASTNWSNQPGGYASGAVTVKSSYGYSSACPANWMKFPITAITQAWAAGSPNYGVHVVGASETDARSYRWFHSSDYNVTGTTPRPPALTVTYNSYPATATTATGGAVTGTDTVAYTGATPRLYAAAADADGATMRLDYEASTATGTVLWTGSVAGLGAGKQGAIDVPAGKLPHGQAWRWRARGFDGLDYGPWSAYKSYTVDSQVPAAPSIECADYPADAWSAKAAGAVTCTLDTTSSDGSGYYWALDDANPTTLAADPDGKGGDALSVTITPGDGWRTLYAKARDASLQTSPVTAYSFGVGLGSLLKPADEDRTQQAVPLVATAPSHRTGVRYEYRADITETGAWSPIPPANVTPSGSATPITAWPQTRADASVDFAELSWNVAATMTGINRGDGPVEVRACFTGGTGGEACSEPVTITLERTAFGDSYATAPLGPGIVALLTGDYSVDATDVNAFDMAVGRDHTTLAPPVQQGAEGVFGPGWTASFSASDSPVAGMQFADHSIQGYVLFTAPDGAQYTYTIQPDGTFAGIGDAADSSKVVKNSAAQFTHTSNDGVKTVFASIDGAWAVSMVDEPGSENTTGYIYDGQGRLIRMLAPVPPGVDCSGTLVAGCKTLDITYASVTTATGVADGWGEHAGLVKEIAYTGYDPATAAMKTTVLVRYSYDSTGHLRTVTDARANLTTIYYYTSQGRLSQLTPSALQPWRMTYDSFGRIADVTRASPQGELIEATAYGIPIGGDAAPVDLTLAKTATWGQTVNLPRIGTALFSSMHVPAKANDGSYRPAAADIEHGQLIYLDVNGRTVNAASFGAGAWQVSATRYDEHGKAVWELTAGNRAQALAPTADTDPYVASRDSSAERADLLATSAVYDGVGRMLSQTGPTHPMLLTSGALASARSHHTFSYDEGMPDDAPISGLPTTVTLSPLVVDGTAAPGSADVRTTKIGYDPIEAGDPSGWELAAPTTQSTVMSAAANIVKRTRYDDAGRVIETRMPASTGTDAGTTVTTYYTADAHPTVTACGNKPEWADLVCRTSPKTQPSEGKPLPVITTSYGYLGQAVTMTEDTGAAVRTTVTDYDAAGRMAAQSVTASPAEVGGTAVPPTTFSYDPATGLLTGQSNGQSTVTTAYDVLGRVISTTDASGATSTVTYDAAGRTAAVHDGKATITYTYDGIDAAGKTERRGLITKIDTGGAGAFSAAYDAAGQLALESHSSGLVTASAFNNAGKQVSLTYAKDNAPWLQFTATPGLEGRTIRQTSPQSSQDYSYDSANRLVAVADSHGGSCETRTYGFSLNSNRTQLSVHPADAEGQCSTGATAASRSYSYDQADRITSPDYTYDAFGRTIQVPTEHVTGGADLQVSYHTNDMVASMRQGDHTATFTRDSAGRIQSMTTTGGARPGMVVNHYTGQGDSPAWITEADGSWSRNVSGFRGLAAIHDSTGTVTLQLTNLHSDVVATAEASIEAIGVQAYFEQTEYGSPRAANTVTPVRYGWLGGKLRSSDAPAGIALMGERLYNPLTGRFLQVDPVVGGSANAYDYANQDPCNTTDLTGRMPDTPRSGSSIGACAPGLWYSSKGWKVRGNFKTEKGIRYLEIRVHVPEPVKLADTGKITGHVANLDTRSRGTIRTHDGKNWTAHGKTPVKTGQIADILVAGSGSYQIGKKTIGTYLIFKKQCFSY